MGEPLVLGLGFLSGLAQVTGGDMVDQTGLADLAVKGDHLATSGHLGRVGVHSGSSAGALGGYWLTGRRLELRGAISRLPSGAQGSYR